MDENENEDESERAVELLGLRDLNDDEVGPSDPPLHNNDSFGEVFDGNDRWSPITAMETNYSGRNNQITKPPSLTGCGKTHASKPSGLKIKGLSLDIDQINQEYAIKEEVKNQNLDQDVC